MLTQLRLVMEKVMMVVEWFGNICTILAPLAFLGYD